jgi:hypothetical protein
VDDPLGDPKLLAERLAALDVARELLQKLSSLVPARGEDRDVRELRRDQVPQCEGGEQARLAVLLAQHDDELAGTAEVVGEDLALEALDHERSPRLVGQEALGEAAEAIEVSCYAATSSAPP